MLQERVKGFVKLMMVSIREVGGLKIASVCCLEGEEVRTSVGGRGVGGESLYVGRTLHGNG